MKCAVSIVLFVSVFLLLAGCASPKADAPKSAAQPTSAKSPKAPAQKPPDKPVITPDETPFGKIVHINANGGFVVITFGTGNIPASGRRLSVYRDNLKVAEVKVTEWRAGDNTVADVMTGDVRINDEVRDN